MTGRFVWYELMTTDPEAAIAFYGDVIGWATQPFGETRAGDGYRMWVGSQGPLGGVMSLPKEVEQRGVPPHWMGHVEVDDLDERVAKVQSKGGKVLVPPTPIPTVGRFSVIADPQGAVLSLFAGAQPMDAHDKEQPGEVSWHELYTDDAAAALSFYGELFGWTLQEEMDMGPAGKYLIYGRGDETHGGMMSKMPDMPMPPSWIYYINVADLDVAIAHATSRGAKTLFGPMEVPGGSRVAQLMDPQGAVFALHGPAKPD